MPTRRRRRSVTALSLALLYASLEICGNSPPHGPVAVRPFNCADGISSRETRQSSMRRGQYFAEVDEAVFWWWATKDSRELQHPEVPLARNSPLCDERGLFGDALRGEMAGSAGSSWRHPVRHPAWYMRPFYYEFDVKSHSFRVPLRRHDSCRESEKARELVTADDLTAKLFRCAYKGQTNRLQACLRAGALINAIDVNHPARLSPVLWAACGGSPRTLKVLAELGADFEARDANDGHALHLAAAQGHVQAAAAVYNITDGNLYARDKQQRVALHLASLEGHTEVVRLLVDLGSNVNAKDNRHDSPLHLACLNGHVETARQLLWLGADPWQQNFKGQMPIDVAEVHGRRDVYLLLESVVGEKCIFDRLPDSLISCGQRHPDEPVELYHREDPADLEQYAYSAPANISWPDQGSGEGKPARRKPAELSAQDIYNNPKLWESTVRKKVDLFPGTSVKSSPPMTVNTSNRSDQMSGAARAQIEGGDDSIEDWDEEWITHGRDPTR